MTHETMTPLRERMIEYMRIHGMSDKAQKTHIRAVKDFAGFLKRSPDTATPDDLRAYQLHMTDTEVTAPTFNARIMALRFLFGTTCNREDMKRYMQFRTHGQSVLSGSITSSTRSRWSRKLPLFRLAELVHLGALNSASSAASPAAANCPSATSMSSANRFRWSASPFSELGPHRAC